MSHCKANIETLPFDRVSERRSEVIENLERVHGHLGLNALILTSRRHLDFAGTADVCVYPEPLGSGTLLYFVTALLQQHENLGGFGKLTDQLRLGERFIPMLRTKLMPTDVPVTPLLVRLFTDRAIDSMLKHGSLDDLPTSVPDLYFAYLRRVNPEEALSHSQMLRATQAVAILSVEPDFVPKEFTGKQARDALLAPSLEVEDPPELSQLVNNGVLALRHSGAEQLFRFVLDPVAEYVGAFALAQRAGVSAAAWEVLRSKVEDSEKSKGFALALKLTWERYHAELRWPSVWSPLHPDPTDTALSVGNATVAAAGEGAQP